VNQSTFSRHRQTCLRRQQQALQASSVVTSTTFTAVNDELAAVVSNDELDVTLLVSSEHAFLHEQCTLTPDNEGRRSSSTA
jgi:hypothetical protein